MTTDYKKLWSSKQWKIKRAEYLKGQVCQFCGSVVNLVVCHDDYSLYNDEEAYSDLIYSAKVLCRSCNMAEMAGLVFCCTDPKTGKNHYRPKDAEYCPICRPPEETARIEQNVATWLFRIRQYRNAHNARLRAIYQERKVKTT